LVRKINIIDFFKSTYQDYQRKQVREEKRCFFDNSHEYVLFSGTALNENGDIRHLNDLYFFLFLLRHHNIDSKNIVLIVDLDIINELEQDPSYIQVVHVIRSNVKKIIDVTEFQSKFKRDKTRDLIFLASGHGDINGLFIGKNETYITSDYFENIASYNSRTILIMTQCFAGAFHHLDTRKNLCVLGASEYQESLSLPIETLINNQLHSKDLQDFIRGGLVFRPQISINPFMFSLFTTLMNIDNLRTKRHFINIYKSTTTFTLQYLKHTKHKLDIASVHQPSQPGGRTQIAFDGSKLIQQPYLLNKIIAARLYVC
jgi:hypothetical protein